MHSRFEKPRKYVAMNTVIEHVTSLENKLLRRLRVLICQFGIYQISIHKSRLEIKLKALNQIMSYLTFQLTISTNKPNLQQPILFKIHQKTNLSWFYDVD